MWKNVSNMRTQERHQCTTNTGPNLANGCQLWPSSTEFGPSSAKFGPDSPQIGRTFGRVRSRFGRTRHSPWPKSVNITVADFGRIWSKFDGQCQNVDESRPNLAEIWLTLATFGRARPDSARGLPILARAPPKLGNFGRLWTNSGQLLTKAGRC